MIKLKDSSDRESVTLVFVAIAFLVISIKFIYDSYAGNPASLLEYAGAFGAILAVWLGREWIKTPKQTDVSDAP